MKSKIFLSMLVIIVAVSLVAGGTMAWFTDSETITSNTFTTGTLNVDLNGNVNTIDLGNVSNMAPGDVMTLPATILIENKGSINLAWFGKLGFAGDPAFKDLIYVDSMKMEFLSPLNDNWAVGGTDEFIKAGQPYGPWKDMSLLDTTKGVVTLSKLMGNPGMNSLGFENMGALKPGYKYRLSFTLGLHESTAGDSFMNKPVSLSYEIKATQIKARALDALILGAGIHEGWFTDQINDQVEP